MADTFFILKLSNFSIICMKVKGFNNLKHNQYQISVMFSI